METKVQSAAESLTVSASNASSAVQVWLVDDNDGLRALFAEVLTKSGGIDCARLFSSPDELLSALASKPGPDVILLDVQMGEQNGLDAVRPIKSLTRATRVLMFTSCNDRNWRQRAFEEGASDYLLKSQALDQVVARIRDPANDPGTGRQIRMRSTGGPQRARPNHQAIGNLSAKAETQPTSRLLRRTLKMLHLFAN